MTSSTVWVPWAERYCKDRMAPLQWRSLAMHVDRPIDEARWVSSDGSSPLTAAQRSLVVVKPQGSVVILLFPAGTGARIGHYTGLRSLTLEQLCEAANKFYETHVCPLEHRRIVRVAQIMGSWVVKCV